MRHCRVIAGYPTSGSILKTRRREHGKGGLLRFKRRKKRGREANSEKV